MNAAAIIRFVGNEGVVVHIGGVTVALDAFFGHGAPEFADTSEALLEAIEQARSPYDSIYLALATHFHPDHFSPRAVSTHLRANPRSRFASTPQSIALLAEKDTRLSEIADRVTAMPYEDGTFADHTFGPIDVRAFALSHGRVNYGDVEQHGLLVRAGGVSMLHLGDGIIHERTLEAAGVFEEEIDLAFLPFWYLTYPVGRRLVKARLRARRYFAIHLPLADADEIERAVHEFLPAATALRVSGTEIRYPAS